MLSSSPTPAPTLHYVHDGYWKISDGSVNVLKCPYEISCLGGVRGGSESCDSEFEGLLCGDSVSGNYIDWTFRDSMQCDNTLIGISLFLSMFVLILLPIYICCFVGVKKHQAILVNDDSGGIAAVPSLRRPKSSRSLFQENDQLDTDSTLPDFNDFAGGRKSSKSTGTVATITSSSSDSLGSRQVQQSSNVAAMAFLSKLKIIIFFAQVASSLPNSLLVSLPEAVSQLLRVYAYLSWANLQALPTKCMSAVLGVTMNFHNAMELASVVPLLAGISLTMCYLLHTELLYLTKTPKQYKSMQKSVAMRYGTLLCMFLYIVAGGVLSLVMGSFQCRDADPDDQVNGTVLILRNDVTLDCTNDMYRYGVLWAGACVAIYAMIIPLAQYITLGMFQLSVQKDELHRLEFINQYAPYRSRSDSRNLDYFDDDTRSTLSTAFDGEEFDLQGQQDTPSNRPGSMRYSRDRGSHSVGSYFSRSGSQYGEFQRAVREQRKRQERLAPFYDAICIMHHAYRPECKFFELFDLLTRVFFMAALPLLSPDNSTVQIVIALTVSVGVLTAVVVLKPFARDDDQVLASVSLGAITTLLLCAMALQVHATGGYADGIYLFDIAMTLCALAPLLLTLYQIYRGRLMPGQQGAVTSSISAAEDAAEYKTLRARPPTTIRVVSNRHSTPRSHTASSGDLRSQLSRQNAMNGQELVRYGEYGVEQEEGVLLAPLTSRPLPPLPPLPPPLPRQSSRMSQRLNLPPPPTHPYGQPQQGYGGEEQKDSLDEYAYPTIYDTPKSKSSKKLQQQVVGTPDTVLSRDEFSRSDRSGRGRVKGESRQLSYQQRALSTKEFMTNPYHDHSSLTNSRSRSGSSITSASHQQQFHAPRSPTHYSRAHPASPVQEEGSDLSDSDDLSTEPPAPPASPRSEQKKDLLQQQAHALQRAKTSRPLSRSASKLLGRRRQHSSPASGVKSAPSTAEKKLSPSKSSFFSFPKFMQKQASPLAPQPTIAQRKAAPISVAPEADDDTTLGGGSAGAGGFGGDHNPNDCFDELLEDCLDTEYEVNLQILEQQQGPVENTRQPVVASPEQSYLANRRLPATPVNSSSDNNKSTHSISSTKKKQHTSPLPPLPPLPTTTDGDTVTVQEQSPLAPPLPHVVLRGASDKKAPSSKKWVPALNLKQRINSRRVSKDVGPLSAVGSKLNHNDSRNNNSVQRSRQSNKQKGLTECQKDDDNVYLRCEFNEETGRLEQYRCNTEEMLDDLGSFQESCSLSVDEESCYSEE